MTQPIQSSIVTTNLADILERVLDKGIVIAGDIRISIADVELISIEIRLIICSVERAKEVGINWWQNNSFLSSEAEVGPKSKLKTENKELREKIIALERKFASNSPRSFKKIA